MSSAPSTGPGLSRGSLGVCAAQGCFCVTMLFHLVVGVPVPARGRDPDTFALRVGQPRSSRTPEKLARASLPYF